MSCKKKVRNFFIKRQKTRPKARFFDKRSLPAGLILFFLNSFMPSAYAFLRIMTEGSTYAEFEETSTITLLRSLL